MKPLKHAEHLPAFVQKMKQDGLEPMVIDTLRLDPRFFGRIDLLDQRFSEGIPSFVHCSSLNIEGDVRFQKNVIIKGDVSIKNKGIHQAVIKSGTIIKEDLSF